MPNHCSSDLSIRGPKEKRDEFAKWLEEIEPLGRDICRALLPYPKHFADRDEEAKVFSFFNRDETITKEQREAARQAFIAKYGNDRDGYNSGGYEWCNQMWGTKWGIYDVEFTPHARGGAMLTFESAWSPPGEDVFRALSKKFPDLTFELNYYERGAGSCGGFTLYSKEDAADYDAEAGVPADEWRCDEYRGSRGG